VTMHVLSLHFSLPSIIHTGEFSTCYYGSSNFKSQLATYIKKLKCILLQFDFGALCASKNHSPRYRSVCMCIYSKVMVLLCVYKLRKDSNLCTENSVVLTVTSLLHKGMGKIVNTLKTVVRTSSFRHVFTVQVQLQ